MVALRWSEGRGEHEMVADAALATVSGSIGRTLLPSQK